MAWNKVFQNWTWHNKDEALDTPLSAQNLQKINNAIDTIDSRVVETGGLIADSDGTTLIDNDGDIELYAHDNLIDIHTDGDIDIVSGAEITLKADSITIDADEVNAESLELNAGNLNINTTRGVVIDGDLGVTGGDLEVDGALSASGALSAGSANISGQASSVYFKSQAANSGGFASLAGGDGLTIKPESESDTLIPAKITKTGAQFYKNGNTYYIQLGEQGVKADKVKIGSDGTISGDGDAVFNNFNIVRYLPSPAANLTGKIFLLTEEDVDYGHGDLWECRLINNQYKWRLCESELKASVDTLTSAKADKVRNATAGNLAGLDSNGNLTDSGVSPTEDVTVEGNPITFDSPFEQDAKSVVVTVKPIQDLHGYDYPWPAGGGKNKLPLVLADIKAANTDGTWTGNVYTISDATFEILTDNADNVTGIKVNGTPSLEVRFSLHGFGNGAVFSENAIMTGCPSGGSNNSYKLYISNNTTSDASDTGNGVSLSPELFNSAIYNNLFTWIVISANYTATNLIFYPMIRLATESDATFAPYSNICPISGTDEVEIEVSGKNLLNPAGKTISSTNIKFYDGDEKTVKAGTYTLSISDVVNGLYVNTASETLFSATNSSSLTFTLSENTALNFSFYKGSGIDPTLNCQLELGTEATDYEPYVSHTTTIPLPSTLYGGDVDVTEGTDTSTYGMVTENNIANIRGVSSGGLYWCDIEAGAIDSSESKASILPKKDGNSAWRSSENCYTIANDTNKIRLYFKSSTEADAKLELAGLQVCYELATPTTLSFDPTDVELLKGTNVVTTNGESIELTYENFALARWEDVKNYVDNAIDTAITQVLASSF